MKTWGAVLFKKWKDSQAYTFVGPSSTNFLGMLVFKKRLGKGNLICCCIWTQPNFIF